MGTMTSTGYKFIDGVPTAENDLVRRKLHSPLACSESTMSEYSTKANVQRVSSIISEAKFNQLFPLADSFYTYGNFLKAVGKFPAFCNEFNADYTGHKINAENLEMTCKRELATLFAHIAYESGKNDDWHATPKWKQGLFHVADPD